MTRKRQKKRGKFIEHGVRLEPHEKKTAEFFLDRGDDVELMVPSYTVGRKNADWLLWGKIWEVKSPQTDNANTMVVMLKRASRQSANLVIDLQRLRGDESRTIKLIRNKFATSRRFKHILIIIKNREVIELKRG